MQIDLNLLDYIVLILFAAGSLWVLVGSFAAIRGSRELLKPLASLKLTVILFALAMFLIFAGTLAQQNEGNWAVVSKYFRSTVVMIPIRIFPQVLYPDTKVPGSFPFPGGFVIGGLLLLNLLSAHVLWMVQVLPRRVRDGETASIVLGVIGSALGAGLIVWAVLPLFDPANMFWPRIWLITAGSTVLVIASFFLWGKRAGIVILHAGVVVLLISEAVTAWTAVEANMSIDEGTYANFAEDIRTTELAIVNATDPSRDSVVVIPQKLLMRAAAQDRVEDRIIRDPLLPFDLRIDRFFVNSTLTGLGMATPQQRQSNPATDGFGKVAIAQSAPAVTGVNAGDINAPAAYVTVLKDGKPLGTWLVSLQISVNVDEPQELTMDGKVYRIALRFERHYKPYQIHLIDFQHKKFVGTSTPRDFRSVVRLIDPTQNEDRTVHIWMNHPLRYNGETFFQSAFKPGDQGTILQVVRNPGWLLPYISCLLVGLGMTLHLSMRLYNFTGKNL